MRFKIVLFTICIFSISSFAQNSISVWSGGLDGSTYQRGVIYANATEGFLFESPSNSSGIKLPYTFAWRGGDLAFKVLPNKKVGFFAANPQAGLQLGELDGGFENKQILIPGTYNFEQMRMGQIGNGNMAIEFVNHQGSAQSYGMKMEVNTDSAPGLNFQYAVAKSDYASLEYQTGMFLARWGNVGIGTIQPAEKLSVKGKIRAQEIKVEADPNTWPDYVFKKDYSLGTLEALESYLKEHQHLPDVPSAEVVGKEGVALGAMSQTLLKKIEELTLHLIGKDKQISKLESAMQNAESRANKLENELEEIKKMINKLKD